MFMQSLTFLPFEFLGCVKVSFIYSLTYFKNICKPSHAQGTCTLSQIKTTNQIKIKTTEKHVYAVSPQHVCYRNANLTFRKVSNFLKQVTKQAEKNYDYDSCRVEGILFLNGDLLQSPYHKGLLLLHLYFCLAIFNFFILNYRNHIICNTWKQNSEFKTKYSLQTKLPDISLDTEHFWY